MHGGHWGSKLTCQLARADPCTKKVITFAIFDEFRRNLHGLKAEMTAVRPSYTSSLNLVSIFEKKSNNMCLNAAAVGP